MHSGQAVRKPLEVRPRPRRTLDERLVVRFPRLFAGLMRSLSRLKPSSRIRQLLLWRIAAQGYAAVNRRDFDVVLPVYDPEVEIVPAPELVSIGIGASYGGHDGFHALWDAWDSAWAGHAQWEPEELIDLGDRILMLGRLSGTGDASGVVVGTEVALLSTLKDGLIIREQHFMDPAQALEAVGLR